MNDQLPDFDQSAPTPETQAPSPKKPRRKPARRTKREKKLAVTRAPKKRRGRPPGAKNKPKRVLRRAVKSGNVTVVMTGPEKLTGPEMETVLGMLQTLGHFDSETRKRILDRVSILA